MGSLCMPASALAGIGRNIASMIGSMGGTLHSSVSTQCIMQPDAMQGCYTHNIELHARDSRRSLPG